MARPKKKSAKSVSRTLFDCDYLRHSPVHRKHPGYPYPWIIQSFYDCQDERFGGDETSIFSDVLEFERHCYLGSHTVMAGPVTVRVPGGRAKALNRIRKLYQVPD